LIRIIVLKDNKILKLLKFYLKKLDTRVIWWI